MKTNLILSFLFLGSLFASCKKETATVDDIKPVQLSAKQLEVVNQTNSFGFDFFKKVQELSGGDHNLMVSPLSVSMALGMARNGAAGATLDSINVALRMAGMTETDINESFKYILATFSSLDPMVKLSIANSIWYRNTFSVEQNFITTNQDYLNAQVKPLDFSDPESVSTINNWCSSNTNQLIPKIIASIPPDMVMYLINAVYFKGQWKYTFDKAQTTSKPFYLYGGSAVEVPTMLQHAGLRYYSDKQFEVVELPYNQGNFNMEVLLPSAGYAIDDIIVQLSQENWNNWSRQLNAKDIQIELPKFKFKYNEGGMIPILSAMGMSIAFDPYNADFTRINSNGGLYISDIKHKTYIETNEEGTEAAAVTSVGVGVTSVNPNEPYNLLINKPFVFFINEKATGSILFIGTVMNPLSEE
jgi:serine protease inhibitor